MIIPTLLSEKFNRVQINQNHFIAWFGYCIILWTCCVEMCCVLGHKLHSSKPFYLPLMNLMQTAKMILKCLNRVIDYDSIHCSMVQVLSCFVVPGGLIWRYLKLLPFSRTFFANHRQRKNWPWHHCYELPV